MTGAPQGPTTFNPGVDSVPDCLSASRLSNGGAGRVVIFLASSPGRGDAWAPGTAVAVAKEWAAQGVRVFLVDLALDDPQLHRVLDLPNEEGIADAFCFGASVQRVAKRIGDLPLFFAPAGTATSDAEAILSNERWKLLVDGFEEAAAALLLFLPAKTLTGGVLLQRATDLVVLGDELPDAWDEGPELLAWISSGSAAALEVATGPGEEDSEPEGPGVAEETAAEDWASSDLPAMDFTTEEDAGEGSWTEEPAVESAPGDEEATADPVFDESLTLDGPAFEGITLDLAEALNVPDPSAGDTFVDAEENASEVGAAQESPQFEEAAAGVIEAGAGPTPESLVDETDLPEAEAGLGAVPAGLPGSEEQRFEVEGAAAAGTSASKKGDRTRAKKRPSWVVWGSLAASLVLGAYYLWDSGTFGGSGAGGAGGEPPIEEPSGTSGNPSPSAMTSTTPATVAALGPPTSAVLGYSVSLRSHSNYGDAQDLADWLSERDGQLLFIVVPSASKGRTWYRTMAGPASNASEIAAVKQRVRAAGFTSGYADWFDRQTGLAFLLDEVGTVEEADRVAAEFKSQEIPAYVLAVRYSGGPGRFRVYAGAYAFESEADPLDARLRNAGLSLELVERVGSMPSGL